MPAYDRAMRRLVFVSHRTGAPQIFFEERASGELVQATDRPDLADWSIIPSARRPLRLFHRRHRRAGASTSTRFEEEQLADFGAVEMREKGMVGAAMGTTALSATAAGGRCRSRPAPVTRFVLIDTEQKTSTRVSSSATPSAIRSSARTTTTSSSMPAR